MIYNMRCCKMVNPLGVDKKHIDFSWKSDVFVKKIRIYVSSSLEACIEKNGDIWDTGWVEQNYNVFWPYEGKELNTHCLYYWNVESVYERDGEEKYDQGVIQTFLTGLAQNEWKGYWISGTDIKNIYNKELLFTKTLKNITASGRIYAYVATYGYHSFYINGKKVENREFAPSRSRYKGYKKAISVAYDITDHIVESENILQILTDAGWTRIEKEVIPSINVQIYSEKDEIEVHTDQTWKVIETGNIIKPRYSDNTSENPFGWADFGNEQIENLEPCGLRNSHFGKTPEILDVNPAITGERTEKDMVLKTFIPVKIEMGKTVRIDMGKNFTGFFTADVTISGQRTIRVKTSDKKEESISYGQETVYLLPAGKHKLRNHFQYISGRYFEISGLDVKDKIENIQGLMIGTNLTRTGYFKCSDEVLNRIFETDLHTFLCNTVGSVTMDCPHRERLGYGETGINTLIGCGLPFFESAGFYSNYFSMWADCQDESGYFPHVVPNYFGGGGTAWSSFPVVGFYEYWRYYHDIGELRKVYFSLKKWCDFLVSNCKKGFLKRYEFGEWDFLGDWAAPDGRNDWGSSEEALMFNNMYFAFVLKIMVELAEYMKADEDSQRWKNIFEELSDNINKKYFRKEEKYYYKKEAKYQALAILADIVPDEFNDAVYQKMLCLIREKGYLDGGSAGNIILLKALYMSEEGNSLIYQWLHRDQEPSYKFFLDNGETTWPEMWNMENVYGGSRIHTCYTGIAGWFLYGLMGVQIQWNKGKLEHQIQPYYPEGLEWAEMEYETPFGKFRYRWEK